MASATVYSQFNSLSTIDPRSLAEAARLNGSPTAHWFGKPNRFVCPRGKAPGVGYILLQKTDSDTLSVATPYTFRFRWEGTDVVKDVSIPSLYIVRKSALYVDDLTPGGNTPVLITVADERVLQPLSSISTQYNVLAADPPATSGTGLYHSESLNSGSLWTWQTMLDDIWSNLPTAESSPTVATVPSDNPQDFRFIGLPAWDAYFSVLQHLGQDLVYNPITPGYTIVDLGVAQSGLADTLSTDTRLKDDNNFVDGVTDFPETIRVFFSRKEEHHGSEKEVPTTGNWEMAPAYSIDKASSLSGAVSDTVIPIWSDLFAIYDFDGNLDNSAALDTRATAMAAGLASKLGNQGRRWRLRIGLHTDILPGSEIGTVVWGESGSGMQTEIYGSILTPSLDGSGGSGLSLTGYNPADPKKHLPFEPIPGASFENVIPLDIARRTHPVYPRLPQVVKVTSLSKTEGLYPGVIVRLEPEGDFTSQTDPVNDDATCWLWPMSVDSGDYELNGLYLARLLGTYSASGPDDRPLLALERIGGSIKTAKVQAAGPTNQSMATKLTVSVKLCDSDGTNVVGDAFNIETPMLGDQQFTSLFTDDVVGFQTVADGSLLIITPCNDDPFNVIKAWGGTADALPPGWSEWTGSPGRVLVGWTDSSPYDTIGGTGGATDHTHDAHTDHTITDHPQHRHASEGPICVLEDIGGADGLDAWFHDTGFTAYQAAMSHSGGAAPGLSHDNNHTTDDHLDPFKVVQWMIRDS